MRNLPNKEDHVLKVSNEHGFLKREEREKTKNNKNDDNYSDSSIYAASNTDSISIANSGTT